MSEISKSIYEGDVEFQKFCETHDPNEFGDYFRQRLIDSGAFTEGIGGPQDLIPTGQPLTADGMPHARVVTIAGQKHVLEASSEEELNEKELALMREHFSGKPAEQTQQPRDAKTGQFLPRRDAADDAQRADEAEAVRLAELDLKFKRGEISAAEYIKKSGAVDDYLAAKGIDAEALAEASQRRESEAAEQEVAKFLENSDWPGGEANQETMGTILLENNLPATAENMKQVYAYMRANDLVKPNEAVEREKELRERVQNAQSIEELKALYGSPAARQFGYR